MNLEIARRRSRAWEAGVLLAQQTYRQQFGAETDPAPDTFVILSGDEPESVDSPGELRGAVAGLTFASEARLFCEHYFDHPIEEMLAKLTDQEYSRSEIVEIGPLASTSYGSGGQLIAMLAELCWCNGAKIAVFTVTRQVHLMLRRMGYRTTELCRPSEEQLPEAQRGIWGTYYDLQPITVFVDVTKHLGEALSLLTIHSPLVGVAKG